MNWFADADGGSYSTWFGLTDDTGTIPGTTPDGAATLAFELENDYTVTLRYPTDVIKSMSGKEQRISRNDAAKEFYAGQALLLGDVAVGVRNTLARSAALGSAFLLGLPHEEIELSDDASGSTVFVAASELALCDWKNPGQRVVLIRENDDYELDSVDAVIQSTGAGSITLDVDPGDVGLAGGRIMPTRQVYLEPQQDFARYPLDAEVWSIRARAAVFDFSMTLASLDLGPLTAASGLDAATVTARVAGSAPSYQQVPDGIGAATLEESADSVIIHYEPSGGFSPSTVTDVYDLLLTSTLVAPTGTWGTGVLSAADEVPLTALAGGDTMGPVGTGATVTEYADNPVWDREIQTSGTSTDGIQAMTEIIDFGGVPYSIGTADQADWFRAVAYSHDDRAEWQWLKLFLSTVNGCQKAFWLSTWRNDLPFVSKATNTITVEGDVGAWWPRQRQHLQIWETSDTFTRAEITDATDNGDGTWTLEIGTTLASSSVQMVSWLELCRFEKDEFSVTFGQHGFSMSTIARGVQQ